MICIYWQKEIPKGEEHQRGEILLKELLPHAEKIQKAPYGKPYLVEGPFFNLSHSGGLIALAVGEQELGLDIEAPREIRHKGFIQSGEEEIDPLTLWVVKESFMKFTGEGIRQFRSVQAEQIEKNLYRVTDGERIAFVKTFQIEGCIAAVAAAKTEEIKTEQIG